MDATGVGSRMGASVCDLQVVCFTWGVICKFYLGCLIIHITLPSTMFATRRIQALRYICVPQAEAGAYWNLVEVTFEQPGTGADSAVLFAVPNPGQGASFDMPVLHHRLPIERKAEA